jgi:aspartyl/asparaginyl-tRNA synthetase
VCLSWILYNDKKVVGVFVRLLPLQPLPLSFIIKFWKNYLTVSGQLEGEDFAMALGQIYFGPTFLETKFYFNHLEFWMIEPVTLT